jgi:hypothetical protein
MEERVRMVNGEFKIRSQGGLGTNVEVHVPLPVRPPDATAAGTCCEGE